MVVDEILYQAGSLIYSLCKYLAEISAGLDRWPGGLKHCLFFAEAPGPVPSALMETHGHIQLQFQGNGHLLWPP